MMKLSAFNNISLDGYFCGKNGEFAWAKSHMDPEFNAFVAGNSQLGGTILLGRITYQLMASYWPTPQAMKSDPVVADGMNKAPKLVFSRTLSSAPWNNTRLVKTDPVAEIRRLKKESSADMVILGSGSIVSQLAQLAGRRISGGGESGGPRRRAHDVRRAEAFGRPQAHPEPDIPERQCVSLLRTGGIRSMEWPNDRLRTARL